MFLEVGFHFRVGEIKDGADLEGAEVGIRGDDVEFRTVRVLHLAQGSDPDRGSQFPHAALERFQLHEGAEFLQPFLIFGRRNRSIDRIAVSGCDLRKVCLEMEAQEVFHFLRVPVSGRAVVTVVHPEDGNVSLCLRGKVKDNRLVGAEVCGDDGTSSRFAGMGDCPERDLQRRFAAEFRVP